MNLATLSRWIEPDREACRHEAEDLHEHFPALSQESLARKVIARARLQAVAAGAATGLAANPLLMLPAALADALAILRIEAHMAGVVAAIFDPKSLESPNEFMADVLAVIFPSAAAQALRRISIHAGAATSKAMIRRYVSQDLIQSTLRFALEFFGMEATQKALISKTVPLVGAGIGAAWNWFEIRIVGTRALRYHHPASKNAVRGKPFHKYIRNRMLPPT